MSSTFVFKIGKQPKTGFKMTHSNVPTYHMHAATTFITHTCIKAVLLEKEEFKINQLYIQL